MFENYIKKDNSLSIKKTIKKKQFHNVGELIQDLIVTFKFMSACTVNLMGVYNIPFRVKW